MMDTFFVTLGPPQGPRPTMDDFIPTGAANVCSELATPEKSKAAGMWQIVSNFLTHPGRLNVKQGEIGIDHSCALFSKSQHGSENCIDS